MKSPSQRFRDTSTYHAWSFLASSWNVDHRSRSLRQGSIVLSLLLLSIPLAIAPTIFATSQSVHLGLPGAPVSATSPERILPSTVQVWPEGTGINPSADLSVLIPAHPPQRYKVASTASSGSNYYWVGAESNSPSVRSNSGIQASIQVISSQVTGCLSFWVGDEMSSNTVWGQVGYKICNSATPVAFYQIWKSGSVAVTGTTAVSTGSHQFSMYLQSGTTWAYALDGGIFGTYNMGSSSSSATYPIMALSEEGYVSTWWNPPQVGFTQIQVRSAGVWSSVPAGYQPYGCTSSSYSCWGAQGNLQNPSVPSNAVVIGGSTSVILSGSTLWNGAVSTSTSSTTTSISTSSSSTLSTTSSSTSSSSTSTPQRGGTLQVTLTVTPSTNTRKSTEYFTAQVTDQYGNPVGGASVSVAVMKPNGKSSTLTASTDSAGQVNFQYKLSAAALTGTYNVSAVASASGYVSAKATGLFTVA
jgi:hypothetical protein